MVRFTVNGRAEPAGSKKAVPTRRDWQRVPGVRWSVVDANANAAGWKNTVAGVAKVAMVECLGWDPQLLEGALYACFDFVRERPKSHLLSDGFAISAAGRQFPEPISKPDLLKLARGVEDAMTEIVYPDDSQIVGEFLWKRWGVADRLHVAVTNDIDEFRSWVTEVMS